MKKILPLCLALMFIGGVVFAQQKEKINLDSYRFTVSYQQIPLQIFPREMKKYAIDCMIAPSLFQNYPDVEQAYQRINIAGWKKVDFNSNPTVRARFELQGFSQSLAEVRSRLVETKDKSGKVTERYRVYWTEVGFRGTGTLTIDALKIIASSEKKNKFLSNANQPNVSKPIMEQTRINLFDDLVFRSLETTTYRDAMKEYELNSNTIYNNYLALYVNSAIARANAELNRNFGFPVLTFDDKLWLINAQTEEGATQIEALNAVKVIFKDMVVDENIQITINKLQPLVDYFESLKTKYPDNDKPSRKIRYSAYFNLGKIYLNTDQPDKAIKEGEGLINNDYDKGDGRRMIRDANALKELLMKANVSSRHQPSLY